jgi:hypothetical protein
MITKLALVGMLGLLSPFGHGPVKTTHRKVAGWTLTVSHDSFSQSTRCALRRSKAIVFRHALVFRLPAQVDTSAAVYRIDGGPPMRVENDAMDLARLGFALTDDDLDNPSGGLVRIPQDKFLRASRSVAIEATPGRRVASFRIDGLTAAMDRAAALGCKADSFD